MKMNNRYTSIILSVALLGLTVACSHDALAPVNPEEQPIRFTTNIGSVAKAATRASDDTWAAGDEVGIYLTDSAYLTKKYNMLHRVDQTGTSVELVPEAGNELYYPPGGSVRFIAYYPYDVDRNYSYGQSFTFELGDQSKPETFDLLWYKDTGDTGLFNKQTGNPALVFKHQFTKIIVNLYLAKGMEDTEFKGVKLTNVPRKIDFDLVNGLMSTPTDKGNVEFAEVALTQEEIEEGIAKRFEAIIIPHEGTPDYGEEFHSRKLEIGIESSTQTGGTIAWEGWTDEDAFESGKKYVYNLHSSLTEVDFLSVTISDWGMETPEDDIIGGSLTLSETECKISKTLSVGELGIKTNNSKLPHIVSSGKWLTVNELSGTDGRYTTAFTAQKNTTGEERIATLTVTVGGMKRTCAIIQEADDGVIESANCIVLVADGAPARIPVAFLNEVGNYPGITDGGETYTPPFADEDNVTFEAKVVWVDVPNFGNEELRATSPEQIIENVDVICSTLDDSYLIVTSGTHPGNAVVCITNPDTDEVIWSWHIWVMTRDDRANVWIKGSMDNELSSCPTPTANGYTFFPLNLGAFGEAGAQDAIFSAAEGWNGHPFAGLYYQWGRKDPVTNRLQPTWIGDGLASSGLPYISGIKFNSTTNANGLKSIKYPHLFNLTTSWLGTISVSASGNNSWGYNTTQGYGRKSPFDPCPAGWRATPGSSPKAYTNVVENAWKDADGSKGDWVKASASAYGIAGYNLENYGGFYPAAGYRSKINTFVNNGDKDDEGIASGGYYWTASPSSQGNYAFRMYFALDTLDDNDSRGFNRYLARSVRCVADNN